MKTHRLTPIFLLVLALLSMTLAVGGCNLTPNATTTPAQALIANENLFSQVLVPAYTAASQGANLFYDMGKISDANWHSKVVPAFQTAHDALQAYHDAYSKGLNPAPGTTGSQQAFQAALAGALKIVADVSGAKNARLLPPTTLPAAPTSIRWPGFDVSEVRPTVAVA